MIVEILKEAKKEGLDGIKIGNIELFKGGNLIKKNNIPPTRMEYTAGIGSRANVQGIFFNLGNKNVDVLSNIKGSRFDSFASSVKANLPSTVTTTTETFTGLNIGSITQAFSKSGNANLIASTLRTSTATGLIVTPTAFNIQDRTSYQNLELTKKEFSTSLLNQEKVKTNIPTLILEPDVKIKSKSKNRFKQITYSQPEIKINTDVNIPVPIKIGERIKSPTFNLQQKTITPQRPITGYPGGIGGFPGFRNKSNIIFTTQ